jgi:hypothetical protein
MNTHRNALVCSPANSSETTAKNCVNQLKNIETRLMSSSEAFDGKLNMA